MTKNCTLWMELRMMSGTVNAVDFHLMHRSDIFSTVHINGKPVELKVDTGTKCNVMAGDLFAQVRQHENSSHHRVLNW